MDHSLSDLLRRLAEDELHPRGFVANASNHTLLVDVGDPARGLMAIYKPSEGERPLWDFPAGSLGRREVAAYRLAVALGWDVVPPTVLRGHGPLGEGSVQLFVPHDPQRHYFVLLEEHDTHEALLRLATFDLLLNNADRKGGHVLQATADGRIVGIDHGLTFHPEPKLRTVIWDFAAEEIPALWRADIAGVAEDLVDVGPAAESLSGLLSEAELDSLAKRAAVLAEHPCLPSPPRDRRPYPWPPL